MKVGNQETLPHCCGVDDVGEFRAAYVQEEYWEVGQELERSGTGLFTATFINNDVNKQHYEQMCKEHTLLYQSPLRNNRNSGRRLFLCVFSYKG